MQVDTKTGEGEERMHVDTAQEPTELDSGAGAEEATSDSSTTPAERKAAREWRVGRPKEVSMLNMWTLVVFGVAQCCSCAVAVELPNCRWQQIAV